MVPRFDKRIESEKSLAAGRLDAATTPVARQIKRANAAIIWIASLLVKRGDIPARAARGSAGRLDRAAYLGVKKSRLYCQPPGRRVMCRDRPPRVGRWVRRCMTDSS